MSRVGKNPVPVPAGVTVDIKGQAIKAKGKTGELSMVVHDEIEVVREGNLISLKMRHDNPRSRVLWGTNRNLVRNLVQGAGEGFTVNLEITGVGYRAAADAKQLKLQLGFQPRRRDPDPRPASRSRRRSRPRSRSRGRQAEGRQIAAEIRGWKPPEPYKGKGIKYAGEKILRKEGKKK